MRYRPLVTSPRHQRGLSGLGWLVALVVVASAITLVLRIGPHYIDFYTMERVFDGLSAREVRSMDRGALIEALRKRFKINNLRDFDIGDIIERERDRDATVLKVAYERREHLLFNVDVVISFQKRFEYE